MNESLTTGANAVGNVKQANNRQSQVDEQFDDLRGSIDQLRDSQNELFARLGRVLTDIPPQPSDPETAICELVPFAENLRALNCTVRDMVENVHSVLGRLEI